MSIFSVSPKPLSREFSTHLDLLRSGAALFVMLTHLANRGLGPDNVLLAIPKRGHDAVILFFVLSGYVISAAADRKRLQGLREFALDRMARVYSVAIPVLLISTVLALLFFDISATPQKWYTGTDYPYITLSLNLVFIGQSWQLNMTPFMNQPFWSLCYEVMYYAGFAFFLFLRGWPRVVAMLLVAILAGPKILILMPCWLLGAGAYHLRDGWRLERPVALLVAFILPVIILLVLHRIGFAPAVRAFTTIWFSNAYELLDSSKDFLIDYVTASLVAVHLYAVRYLGMRWPEWLNSVIATCAAMSFTLYLLHDPLLSLVAIAFGPQRSGWEALLVATIGVPIICYGIAGVTELRRGAVRQWLDRWLPGGKRAAA